MLFFKTCADIPNFLTSVFGKLTLLHVDIAVIFYCICFSLSEMSTLKYSRTLSKPLGSETGNSKLDALLAVYTHVSTKIRAYPSCGAERIFHSMAIHVWISGW